MIPETIHRFLAEDLPPRLSMHFRAYQSWRWGDAELKLLPMLCSRTLVGIDVGGYWGMYAYFIALFSKRLIVVEPNPSARVLLRQNFGSKLNIIPAALSDQNGEKAFLRVPILGGSQEIALGTLAPENHIEDNAKIERIEVTLRTLDSIDPGNVGFVKIDVEGHEEAVLRGASRMIATSQPNFLIEVEERHNPGGVQNVHAFMSGYGYRTYFWFEGRLHPFSGFVPEIHQDLHRLPLGSYMNNFVYANPGTAARLEKKWFITPASVAVAPAA